MKHSTKFILWNYHIPSRWLHVHKTFPMNLLTLLANLESFVGNYMTTIIKHGPWVHFDHLNNLITKFLKVAPPNYVEWHVKLSHPSNRHCLLDENLILRFKLTTSNEGCPQFCIFLMFCMLIFIIFLRIYHVFMLLIVLHAHVHILHSTRHIMC